MGIEPSAADESSVGASDELSAPSSAVLSLADEKVALEIQRLSLEIKEKKGWRAVLGRAAALAAVVSSVVLTAIALWAWLNGRDLLDIEQRRLAYDRWALKRDLGELDEAAQAWANASARILDEPSGLAPTRLQRGDEPVLALAVDDEVGEIFLLQSLGVDRIGVSYVLLQEEREINDLEAACFDGRFHYVVTSHRDVNDSKEMAILRFELLDGTYEKSGHEIEVKQFARSDRAQIEWLDGLKLALDPPGGPRLAAVGPAGDDSTVNGRIWRNGDEANAHPYAFEIEGAACGREKLWLGLLYPAAPSGNPIVLEHDLIEDTGLTKPIAYELEIPSDIRLRADEEDTLAGRYQYGISAMAFDADTGRLLVAVNPSAKGDDLRRNGVDPAHTHGKSRILWYDLQDGSFVGRGDFLLPESDSKLEGLAVTGGDLWLAYEGQRTVMLRVPITHVYGRR